METFGKLSENMSTEQVTGQLKELTNGKPGTLRLVIFSAIILSLSFFISPKLGEVIKRSSFFMFFAFFIISAYSFTTAKVSKKNNLVMDIEILTKEISEYISSGAYMNKYKTLSEFIPEVMDENRHVYSMWVAIDEDDDDMNIKKSDSVYSFRNNGRRITMTRPVEKTYKNYKEMSWYKKGESMFSDSVTYNRGIWIEPFVEDKLSTSLLFPCIYPIIKDDVFKGVVACCLTLYSNENI